jgi:Ca-activated chloride channel family protein
VTAGQDAAQKQDSMDYVFVVDASGSMADEGKLLLSKDAVAAFLNELGESDRFEIMTFNVMPNLGFKELLPGNAASKQRALQFLSTQQARGGTVLQPAISTAYKYASNDRPLNVIILSDGLTDQQDRAVLLQQIQKRPGNTRVFCIGVGNDVNRPLLEQLADDSGGLAAFISPGDNFERQAKAFRQKLMRPFATNLEIKFAGMEVYDVEPTVLPNLYFGAPVRVYGRYRSSGTADVTLRGSVNGVEIKETAPLDFPKADPANPEINRMWAWHRVNRLLKDADRKGDRSSVIPEVVRLGEDFSIATEYTSFLVLENDAEYQRWKISRRNLDNTGRERMAEAKLREELDTIRNKALANLGPQAAETTTPSAPVRVASAIPSINRSGASPAPPAVQAQPAPVSNSRQSWSLGTGSSPVGPLGVLGAAWLLRRKRKIA